MSNLTTALLIVLSINVLLFLGQVAVTEINPTGTQFFNYSGSLIAKYDAGGYVLNDTGINNQMPELTQGVSETNNNFFTDPIGTIKNWFLESTGLNYVAGILRAPANFLEAIGMPQAMSFAIGVLWYVLTFFLLLGWLFGRDS